MRLIGALAGLQGEGMFKTALVIAAVYLAVVLAIYLLQARLLYIPQRKLDVTPEEAGMACEDVHLRAADGVALHAWHVRAPGEQAVLLFCHGNAGNISYRLGSIAQFATMGLSVLIFDYRGYGQSGGHPTEQGTYLDARAAWDYLVGTLGTPPARIVVFGRSLGAAVAAELARQVRPGALILESGFTSCADIGRELYPWLPVRWLLRYRYPTVEAVAHSTCPTLIVHSPDDDIVPWEHGRHLYRAAPEPKSFLQISGDHNTGFLTSGKAYTDGVRSFLEKNGILDSRT